MIKTFFAPFKFLSLHRIYYRQSLHIWRNLRLKNADDSVFFFLCGQCFNRALAKTIGWVIVLDILNHLKVSLLPKRHYRQMQGKILNYEIKRTCRSKSGLILWNELSKIVARENFFSNHEGNKTVKPPGPTPWRNT